MPVGSPFGNQPGPVTFAIDEDVPVWVRVEKWMIVDGEQPLPTAGSALRSAGLRVRGAVTGAGNATPDGVVEVQRAAAAGQPGRVYAITGVVGNAKDVFVGTGRPRVRHRRVGAEFLLTVGEDRFHVSFDGRGADVTPDSRVTVTGELELLGEYEWEAFDLIDTRADWRVADVARLPNGDVLVDITRAQDDEPRAT